MDEGGSSIAEVERETGLSKDKLRVWERRYGFPQPSRNTQGDREYPKIQVDKLKLVRRLLDKGMRPGRIIQLSLSELQSMSTAQERPARSPQLDLALFLLRTHQTAELRRELSQSILREGVFRFITETAAPLTGLIGDAWMRGELRVFEEHLFTELLQGLLRSAIAQCSGPGGLPRILLATLPSEQHGLGMLMAEAVLALEGAECIPLGLETPIAEVVDAASSKNVQIVALSFSANFPPALLSNNLKSLRRALPAEIALWCGGAGMARAKGLLDEGVEKFGDLRDIRRAIAGWRAGAG